VQALITTDQFVAKAQARHQSSLFQPEYGGKAPAEKDAFHSGKRDDPDAEIGVLVVDPIEGPFCFPLNARHRLNGVEEFISKILNENNSTMESNLAFQKNR